MPKPVKWTPKAGKSFDENIDYLNREWTSKEVSKFAQQTLETIETISAFPASYVQDKAMGLRIAKVNKIISLVYLEKEDHIELLYFWNNTIRPYGQARLNETVRCRDKNSSYCY